MTHTIELPGVPDELIKRLDERLRETGQDRAEYLIRLIERDLAHPATVDEILEPFRQGFKESGMSEEELTELIDTEVRAVRAEKRAKSHTDS